MNEKLDSITRIIQEIEYAKYKDIDLNSLVCYIAWLFEKNNIPINFENIYVGAFIAFPFKFCLVDFPEFPDGARINRAILQCQPKYQNLLTGRASIGYKLTEFGINKAEKVNYIISSKESFSDAKADFDNVSKRTVDYSEKVVKLKNKSAFKKFIEGKVDQIGMDEVFDILGVSPFDHKMKINKKLRDLDSISDYAKSDELNKFVKWIRNNKEFKHYLGV